MSGPHPAVAQVRTAVRTDLETIVRPSVPPPGRPLVLVACSGGPDSLALAAGLAFVAPRHGWAAGAVIVDHDLQPGSDRVAARAAEQCTDLGLAPVEVARAEIGTYRDQGGPEAVARTARYAAIEDVAARRGAVAVLLGHTLDDQAETVLLALARGSGTRSLAGMASVRGLLRRPLLGVRRAVLQEACEAQGLTAWQDPTNDVGGNRRADVRHRLLPELVDVLGPGVTSSLARTADLLREDAVVLDGLAAELLGRATVPRADLDPASGPALDVLPLAEAAPALRRRALRSALVEWGSPAGSLAATHVLAVEALVTAWSGQGPVQVPGITVARRCGRLSPEITS